MSKTIVQVMYPVGGEFDWDYYLKVHMPMVEENLDLTSWSVLRGSDAAIPATYQAIAFMTFESEEKWAASFAKVAPKLLEDIPKYTNVTPTVQVSTVVTGPPPPGLGIVPVAAALRRRVPRYALHRAIRLKSGPQKVLSSRQSDSIASTCQNDSTFYHFSQPRGAILTLSHPIS